MYQKSIDSWQMPHKLYIIIIHRGHSDYSSEYIAGDTQGCQFSLAMGHESKKYRLLSVYVVTVMLLKKSYIVKFA